LDNEYINNGGKTMYEWLKTSERITNLVTQITARTDIEGQMVIYQSCDNFVTKDFSADVKDLHDLGMDFMMHHNIIGISDDKYACGYRPSKDIWVVIEGDARWYFVGTEEEVIARINKELKKFEDCRSIVDLKFTASIPKEVVEPDIAIASVEIILNDLGMKNLQNTRFLTSYDQTPVNGEHRVIEMETTIINGYIPDRLDITYNGLSVCWGISAF